MTNRNHLTFFVGDCTRRETILGWAYLPVHVILIPLLLPLLQMYLFPDMTEVTANGLYYGVSLAVVLVGFWKLLRREFDHLCDRLGICVYAIVAGYALWYFLAFVMTGLTAALGLEQTTPSDQAIDAMASQGFNLMLVLSVIAAPILEEVLFRGIVFQSIRKHSRMGAYAASMVLFSLYHVWQFAFYYQDVTYLLYAVQYLPITFAITWSYEYSGSLWTAIFFHASNNYLAMQVMQAM